jgi:hypothetical protein
MKYSVRKWYYVDTIVEASSKDEANDIVNDRDCNLKNLEYFGDVDGEPDIWEMDDE